MLPCDFAVASSIVLKLPATAQGATPAGADESKHARTGAFAGSAILEPDALQNLVDALPDILKAAAGTALQFHLNVSLGNGAAIDAAKLDEINALLEAISPDLRLKG